MEATESGIVMAVAPEQREKAPPPMEVTGSGVVMAVALEQPAKATHPMEVMDPGIVMAVALQQPQKAHSPTPGDGVRDRDGVGTQAAPEGGHADGGDGPRDGRQDQVGGDRVTVLRMRPC